MRSKPGSGHTKGKAVHGKSTADLDAIAATLILPAKHLLTPAGDRPLTCKLPALELILLAAADTSASLCGNVANSKLGSPLKCLGQWYVTSPPCSTGKRPSLLCQGQI